MLTTQFKFTHNDLKQYSWIGAWEEDGDVFLWRRENGERKITKVTGVPRYFCIRVEDYNKTDKWPLFKANKLFTNGIKGKKYAYIYLSDDMYNNTIENWLVTLDDMGITPLEGDLRKIHRLFIEMNLRIASPNDTNPPVYCFYDIETDDRGSEINIGEDRILSIAIKDGQTGEEFFYKNNGDTDEAEKAFLKTAYSKLIKYDVVIGYNNYSFDDPYMLGRMEKLGIDPKLWRRIAKLDMFNLFERQHTFSNYDCKDRKLDTISKRLLNRGKVEHSEKIYELWENNPDKLAEYNMEDVRLIYDLEELLKSARLVMEVMAVSGTPHSIGFSPYKVIDMLLLRKAQQNRDAGKEDVRFPTAFYRPEHKLNGKFSKSALAADRRQSRGEILKDEFDIDYNDVKGALVLEVTPGLHRNVFVSDFNSLYPNTIRAFNIGWETMVPPNWDGPKNQAPNGIYFRTDKPSSLAETLEMLLNSRAEVRAQMKNVTDPTQLTALDIRQNALKELANSGYGILALWGGRWYNHSVAESVTSGGRYFLPYAVEFFETMSENYKVVAGDTDSFFLKCPKDTDVNSLVEEYLKSLREHIRIKFNAFRPEVLKMSVEKGASVLFIVAKKNYAMRLFMKDGKPTDKMVIKGLRLVKGNMSKWSSKLGKQMVDYILDDCYSAEFFEDFLAKERARLAEGNVDYRELIISARIGKELEDYKSELPHLRVAKRLIANGIFVPTYSTINYIITNGDSKIVAIDEREIIWGESKFDVSHYWGEFMAMAEEYLGILYPEINWNKYQFPKNLKRTPFRCEALIKKI
jgi:DNA polymerase elongation subunit (family B)